MEKIYDMCTQSISHFQSEDNKPLPYSSYLSKLSNVNIHVDIDAIDFGAKKYTNCWLESAISSIHGWQTCNNAKEEVGGNQDFMQIRLLQY